MKTVLIIGDSLVQGGGATGSYGWAQIVAATFSDLEFDIQGVGGDTAERVWARWPEKTYDLVILQVGTNDSCYRVHKGGPEATPERFAKYLGRIRKHFDPPSSSQLLLVGLFGVDASRANTANSGKIYSKAALDLYESIITKFAARHGIQRVSLCERPVKPTWLADGLHPNDVGHAYIASHVVKALRRRFNLIAHPPGPGAGQHSSTGSH